MTVLTLIISLLTGLFTPKADFWFECRQIGDNEYTCDGGRL